MHVLIVDDEPVIRRGMVKMAELYAPAFSKIQTAENGEAALEQIRASEPDLVLTDVRMPKMDGLELCKIIHEEFPHIKTVVISGYNDFEYAQKSMNYGVRHYLLKPATKSDVHDMLDQLIKKPKQGYLSPSRYIEWIDQMEQQIWALQMEEFGSLIVRWREYCLSANISLAQLKELLDDCNAMLVKRFQARHYSPSSVPAHLQADSVKEVLDAFEKGLLSMISGLHAVRSGHFKDPMEEAKAYIDSRLSEDISLDQVAAMVGLTPTYFSSLFKKITQETFVQYRISKRMAKAKEMLAAPHVRIVDVAADVGYDDYPHFTKTFKKIVGVSPTEYRSSLGIK
ncbi:response regulator transcription factor [Paenibacillus aceris]|uniref:Two-component system response regulator YesN n=1 Tax=Paenibacillus aceris TaxID=869555 RepID=A0ABS4HUM3_9BACL|nr:response regulator [Paenibacillus aceris]MBP1962327.1 two-component system response regulator YesN [Paenibacillus aceris]NHW37147.1 response regulator [Paenibacillus aceris]